MPKKPKLIAPNLTPYNADGSPDVDLYVEHAKRVLEDGCDMIAPFGTTGEANSLGMSERMALLEALIGSGIAPKNIIPGTGLASLEDTVILSRHATQLGVAGVMTLPPFYYKDVSDDGLFAYFAKFIDRVDREDLRIYLYHIPPVAKVGFSVALVKRLVGEFPAVIVGIKDSSGDWENTAALLKEIPSIDVFPGNELQLRRALGAGSAGCITATANVNATAIRHLIDIYDSVEAHQLESWVDLYRKTIQPHGPIPAMKALLALESETRSWAYVRPPLMPLAGERAAALAAELSRLNDELQN